MFTQGRTGKVTVPARAPAKGKESVKPTVTPDEGLFGKVILVTDKFRFIDRYCALWSWIFQFLRDRQWIND